MRLLHTSDWHIGRTFHGHSTDTHLSQVLAALADAVREHQVDVVVVAGDVFDSSTPKAEAFRMLNDAVSALRDAGATVVLTSGNHDGPARLGHMAQFAAFGGVHVMADLTAVATPAVVGDVLIYGIPYVHPEFLRAAYADFEGSTHQEALAFCMGLIRDDALARGGVDAQYVVASHCFASGVSDTTEESGRAEERDISRGGLNIVGLETFDGPCYVALGHIHSRAVLSERIRYSGAPLRFSFGEISSAKGAWLVELGAPGASPDVSWLDLPTPREAVSLTGTLEELLALEPSDAWVDVVLTDDQLPRDAMRALQARHPHAVTLAHRPANRHEHGEATYAERIEGKSDLEVVDEFLAYVRNGLALTAAERPLVTDALGALEAKEQVK